MANPIKTSDIYQDDGSLKKLIADLEAVRGQLEALKKEELERAGTVEKATRKLNETRADEQDQIVANAKAAEEIQKRYSKYTEALDDNAVKIAALKNAQTQLNQINKLEAKILMSKEGSYERLSAQYGLNKIRLNQMSAEERSATEEGKKLEKESFDLYQEMKRLQEVTGKHVLSVGDYAKATRGLLEELREQPGAAGQMTQGLEGIGRSMKALMRNPLVLFLSLAAAAIATLFSAFKRSEKGADLMAKATGLVNGILSELTDIAVKVVDGLVAFANDPLEGIKNLGKAIVENILNRFKAIPLVATAALNALKALWNRDMEGLKEAGVDAMTAVNQAITGLDAEGQQAFADAVKETTKDILDQTNAFIKLEASKRSVHRTNRDLLRSIEDLITAEELNKAVADDATKSFEERNAASEKANEALAKRSKAEVQVARNNLSLLNQEIGMRKKNQEDVEALLDQQLESYRELAAAERNYTLAVRDNERIRAELKQDELEKDLDILIDGFDNQKTVNERIIKDETKTFEERRRLLEQTVKLADDSFAKQIETIQRFTGVQVDANALISESDAVVLNQKIRSLGLSEIIEGRVLEIVRERRIATLDLADAEKELNLSRDKALKAELEAQKKVQQERFDVELEAFDQLAAMEESKLDLVKHTEAMKTKAQLEAQRDRLKKMLELDEKYLQDLNAIQIATIQNQIKAIDRKIGDIDSGGINDIYSLFGFNLEDDQKQAISDSFAFAKEQVSAYLQGRVDAANTIVERSNEEVTAAQANVNAQIEAGKLGYANKFQQAQQELELAKKTQAKALEEQRKAQRAQQAIQAIEQAGNMITASSKVWAQLGFPLAIPALAIMWGSFLTAQVQAFSATRQFKEGGFELLDYGGSHASGRDISLGTGKDGIERRAERDESFAVFNRRSTSRYRSSLPRIVNAINRGTFERMFVPASAAAGGSTVNEISLDSGRMEDHLSAIRRRGEEYTYTDSRGRTVRVRKNVRTTYVG